MYIQGENIAISCVANKAYLPQYAACVVSFLAHHNMEADFFLYSDDAIQEDIEPIKQILARKSCRLTLIKIDATLFESFTGFWANHGRQVFYRFLIPDLLPQKFRFVLYFDVDIIFYKPLDFAGINIHQSPLWAVQDSISNILAPKRGLTHYFNSGLMLIDAAYWRSNQVTKSLFNLEPPKRLFADQDILNEYFKNNWSQLPATYNYSANTLQLTANGYRCANGEKPAVIHFNGGIKPWKYWVRGSFIYWRYIWKTPYKSLIFAAPKTVLNSMMHFLKKRM